ncbi:DUF6377 domain-containing protein [Marinifilum flexuosum]|uniref:DUF6377 domain-containing protein n=1 Tax=Marinifilum flexuosum TaxID=1117708 RepID=UPI002493CA4E|nr:DUF6377 domain-containing protein [Marinifilum flexuosum]
MYSKQFILLFLILVSFTSYSNSIFQTSKEKNVNYYLNLKDSIDDAKWRKINSITASVNRLNKKVNLEDQYHLFSSLSKEYEYFVYDSAFHYGNKSLQMAYQLKDAEKIAESKSNLALVLLLKGLYKETIDTIQTIRGQDLPNEKRIEFYAVAYRAYYDLANSRWGYYSPKYRKLGDQYVDKIEKEGKNNFFHYNLALALKNLNNQKDEQAVKYYTKVMKGLKLDPHQMAICQSGMGVALARLGKADEAKKAIEKAVIGDVLSATKETLASKILAEILFYEGDLEKANKLIEQARKDAEFYGSDVRRLEISFIQPDIDAAVVGELEKEKKQVVIIGIVISVMLIVIVVLAIVFFKQLQELKKVRKEIGERNENLGIVNESLREVSRIKEEYVGYYFNFSSQFIEKMEGMKKAISRQLMTKQYDAIELELKNYNPKKERQLLFEDFDRIFLKLFPDFVKRFNLLFEESERIILKDSHCLNTDLRIFALIRLGVNDNEKIASILNFSVNTIYTYKTRIKNRSLISNDEFEAKIMEIKSV